MAKQLNPESANQTHEVGNRLDIMMQTARRVAALKLDRSEINALITEAKADVKALDITMKDFEYWVGIFEIEDPDKRAKRIADAQECAQALGLVQGELFPIQPEEAEAPQESEQPAEPEEEPQAKATNGSGRGRRKRKTKSAAEALAGAREHLYGGGDEDAEAAETAGA